MRQPKQKVVNKKAVDNIGVDTVINFNRYNRVTKQAIGRRIVEMAGQVGRADAKGVYSFDPEHGCGSVPLQVLWRKKFKHVIVIVVGGVIIIVNVFPPIPKPEPNPVDFLKTLDGVEFGRSIKQGDTRTINMNQGGKKIGEIRIIADKFA